MINILDLRRRNPDPDGEPVVPLEEVCRVNEILAIRGENERRGNNASEAKARAEANRGKGRKR